MKKILALSMIALLAIVAVVGGTLAYFTDTDAQRNTFTTGNVDIDLWEDFGENNGFAELIPAVGSAQAGNLQNGVEKEVYVTNDGSEDAYVRVHIAIPAILDNGDPSFDASANILHFNYASETAAEGQWDWSKSATDGKYSGNWNYYETTINGVDYNVYVVTYTTALKTGETTTDAIQQVYLDSEVTNSDVTTIKGIIGDQWYIYVAAEGTQAAGFENAYDALNTSFGDPSAAGYTGIDFSWDSANGPRFWINND